MTIHLIKDELRAFLREFPIPEMDEALLEVVRAASAKQYPPSSDVPDVVCEERILPGHDSQPDVRVLLYRPTETDGTRPAILHMHGGGYVLGAPEMSDASNRRQAAALGLVIVSVDYRLPPENPYPAPLDDCYHALKWLHANAVELGVDTSRIIVKGESAGGGLAAGLVLLARDRGELPVAFQCLTYPMIEDRRPKAEHPFVGEFIWTPRSNRFGWKSYLGVEPGSDEVSPYAAPARAEVLEGLPPTLLITTALDLFFEENLEYARRLTRAGVPVDLIVYSGAYHGFTMAGDTEISRRYEADVRRALASI